MPRDDFGIYFASCVAVTLDFEAYWIASYRILCQTLFLICELIGKAELEAIHSNFVLTLSIVRV